MGIRLECDGPGCDQAFFLEKSDKIGGQTLTEAHREGWRTLRLPAHSGTQWRDTWGHYCPHCVEVGNTGGAVPALSPGNPCPNG